MFSFRRAGSPGQCFHFLFPKSAWERSENMPFPISSEMARKYFSLYKHVGSQVQLLISLHTDAALPGNPCPIVPAEGHNGEKQWRACLLLMTGYRVLYSLSNSAKIFWQPCLQSTVTAINSCPWLTAEGTLVLGMLSCKIQMAVSAGTDQSDAVSRCPLYACELTLEFFTCSLPQSEAL